MEKSKNLLVLTTLLSLLFGFLAPLVIWFTNKNLLADEGLVYLKNLLNFELTMFIIMFVFGFVFAPVSAVLGFVNVVILILATINLFNNKSYKFPFFLELIK